MENGGLATKGLPPVDREFRFSDILVLGVVILRLKLYLNPLCEVRYQFARSFSIIAG